MPQGKSLLSDQRKLVTPDFERLESLKYFAKNLASQNIEEPTRTHLIEFRQALSNS